jgi:hypothetical protein
LNNENITTNVDNNNNSINNNTKLQQLVAVDLSNKRIIDQLNGQVDFLNEQLALRETQLVEISTKISQYDALNNELESRFYFTIIIIKIIIIIIIIIIIFFII